MSDVILVSNYHGCKEEAIKLIPYYMIDIIYKTVKSSLLKKNANHTKYKKSNVASHLHIFWLNFDKVNHSFLHPFLLLGEKDFRNNVGRVISFCLGRDDKNLGTSYEWGGLWVKILWISAFSRSVNSINLKVFPHMVEYKSLREIQQAF